MKSRMEISQHYVSNSLKGGWISKLLFVDTCVQLSRKGSAKSLEFDERNDTIALLFAYRA